MASETALSESAVNKSVDQKTEEPLLEKTMDEVDVSKVVGDFPVLDSKDEEKLKEAEILEIKENENLKEQTLVDEEPNDEKVTDEADVSKTVDDPPVLDFKDTEIFEEEKEPPVRANEIPNEQATVNEGINIKKAQDEAELSRPIDISSISDSKDKDILKEQEGIEVKEMEPPEEQQIIESATNETLEIPKTPEVEETNLPKDEETEIITKEDSMKARESNLPKEVEVNKDAIEGSSKEEEIPVVPGDSSAKKRDTLEAMEKEKLKEEETPDLAEKEKSFEQINKDQALTGKGNEEPSNVVEEDKVKNEAFESAGGDRDKEATVAESREVQVPVVPGAGSKTEDVPPAVVTKDTKDGAKPAARRSTDIFRHIGSKMMQMVQKMRNGITRKSSNAKVAK